MKTLQEFIAQVHPVSGQTISIPNSGPVNSDPNANEVSFKGFEGDVIGKIMDGATEAQLQARYGPNWRELALNAAAVAKQLGPKERPATYTWQTVGENSMFVSEPADPRNRPFFDPAKPEDF